MDCVYQVPIPQGMTMNISFEDFYLADDPSCRYRQKLAEKLRSQESLLEQLWILNNLNNLYVIVLLWHRGGIVGLFLRVQK